MHTVTITMTPAQSETWTLGGPAAHMVEEELAEQLQDVGFHGVATVLVDDHSVVFCLEM
jgi:hypothetical protein